MANKISQPTVATITAELNVVKIGNKQMTVSVYNQLYIENCWDKEYNILYPIWGKTNRDGEFVIFQKGNELRKCRIPTKWGKLNFDSHLIRYIKTNREYFAKPIPMNDPNWKQLNSLYEITYLHIDSIDDKKLNAALSVMDEKIKKEHQEIFKRDNWMNEKREKMINELLSSRQLFIAI